jgi:hypothetical protein
VNKAELSVRWLSSKPTWSVRDHTFTARTPWLLRGLTLFGWDRLLHVDTNRRALFFGTRRFWFVTRTVIIPFTRIKSIIYGYSAKEWTDFSNDERGPEVTERLDRFHVGLLMRDSSPPMHLFTFHGHYVLAADKLVDWLVDEDDLIELSGGEEETSREFVRWLRKYIGAPVRSLMHAKVHEAMRAQLEPCPRCARPITRNAEKCIYCGTRFRATA